MAERLTFEGNFCEIARCRENRWGKHCPDGACSQRKVWERLKQYEDSDAVPARYGHWIFHEDDYWDYVECSECHDEFISWEGDCAETNYCPSCGADMRERKSK